LSTTLTATLSHQQTIDIIQRLASLFTVKAPAVVFDANMPGKYIAYCWPQVNEIHFRSEYIPWNSPFHEFAHILYTDYTGGVDNVKSEAFAQYFAAMSLTTGQDLLDFACQVCGNSMVTLRPDGTLECQACDSLYAIEVLEF
jgi:hypothetical protein